MNRLFWPACLLALVLAGKVEAANIVSSFDFNADGWTASGASVGHEDSGGNPGGFLTVTDTAGDTATAIPPAKFRGNLLAFDRGLLSYDLIVLEPQVPVTTVGSGLGRIQMNGGGSNATFDYAPNPPLPSIDFWTAYLVPMTAEAWNTTQANWELVLSGVTHLDVIVEAGSKVGLDNFELTSVVPEPSSLMLLSFGLLGLASRRRSHHLHQDRQ